MLKLENVPPEQMPEVVHIASELYEKDQQYKAESQERNATVKAAAEVGLPEEYLHLAAQQWHVRRVEEASRKRRRRTGVLAVAGAALVMGVGGWVITHPRPIVAPAGPAVAVTQPAAPMTFTSANWTVTKNTHTKATTTFENGSATLRVDKFATDSAGHFTANLNSTGSGIDLSKYKTVSFNVRGTLPHVRLYLEHGNERWRSPELAVGAQDQLIRINLDQFEHQTRANVDAQWKTFDHSAPSWVDRLSFKTGWYVNDAGASGNVTLSDFQLD
jgi:hypothetical protein